MKDKSLFALNCLLMIEHSVILLIMGPLIPELMRSFGIGETSAGLLLGAGSLGGVIGPLLAGLMIDRKGMKTVIVTGLLAEVVFLVLFGLSTVFWAAAMFNFILILFAGSAETSVNIIPAMIRTTNPGRIMNLVHLTFSLGAFIMPLLAGLFLSAGGEWRYVIFAAAIPAGVLALLFAFSGFPGGKTRTRLFGTRSGEQSNQPERKGIKLLLKNHALLLGMLTLFLYVGGELGFSAWSVNYLEAKLGFSKMQASAGMSFFWIGIMLGRLLNSLLSGRLSGMQLIGYSSLITVAAGIPFLLVISVFPLYILIFLIGLGMAGGYPNTMVAINRKFSEDIGSATGMLAFGSGLGAMFFQWLMGIFAERLNLTASMIIPLALMALMVPAFYGAAGRNQGSFTEQSLK